VLHGVVVQKQWKYFLSAFGSTHIDTHTHTERDN